MARTVKPLNDVKIKNAKKKDKAYKLFDGGGLYLEVTPKGSRLWRMKYRFNNKEQKLSLGAYPDVSLGQARRYRDEAGQLIANGVNPSDAKKAQKQVARNAEKTLAERSSITVAIFLFCCQFHFVIQDDPDIFLLPIPGTCRLKYEPSLLNFLLRKSGTIIVFKVFDLYVRNFLLVRYNNDKKFGRCIYDRTDKSS